MIPTIDWPQEKMYFPVLEISRVISYLNTLCTLISRLKDLILFTGQPQAGVNAVTTIVRGRS